MERKVRKRKAPKESTLVANALAWLKANVGGEWIRYTTRYGKSGVSDILGCLPGGRFVAIECKRSKSGQYGTTALQEAFLKRIVLLGATAIVVDCIEDLERAFPTAAYDGPCYSP